MTAVGLQEDAEVPASRVAAPSVASPMALPVTSSLTSHVLSPVAGSMAGSIAGSMAGSMAASLRLLDLAGTGLTARGCASLAIGLADCGGLEELFLGHNPGLGDAGCAALAAHLRHDSHPHLTNVQLTDTGLEDCALALVQALVTIASAEPFGLSHQRLSTEFSLNLETLDDATPSPPSSHGFTLPLPARARSRCLLARVCSHSP